MHKDTPLPSVDHRATFYDALADRLRAIMDGEPHPLPNLANAAAVLFDALPDVNWCGFYLTIDDTLVLGPFQGKPACIRIPVGRGVCGCCAASGQTCLVPDVHRFPGHIACDSASNSEIVLPLFHGEKLFGVLDIDSPLLGRFTKEDQAGLEVCAKIIEDRCADWHIPTDSENRKG